MGGYDTQKNVLARANTLYTDVLSLEVRDVVDALPGKQFETADVLAAHNSDRLASIDRNNECWCVVSRKIDLAARERESGGNARIRRNVADIGKAFRTQEVLRDILGRNADSRNFCQANCGGFRRPLLSKQMSRANKACSPD